MVPDIDSQTPSEASRLTSDLAAAWSAKRPFLKRRRKLFWFLCLAGAVAIWWFVPPVYKLIKGPVTVTRWDRKAGETKAVVGPGQKEWISTQKISKHALHAIIAAEDGKFYEHHGFDFASIWKSYEINKKRKRYVRGGSTISQQVVKMAFLGREKTLIRKAREAVGTALMELILPKDKILEWYINLAEFGDGVYGVEEGCWHYFKTKPELLTIEQAVHLALVLPSPNAWSRGLKSRSLTSFGHRRFAAILNTMRSMGFVTKTQWMTAVTRGDFGRPIQGYAQLLQAEEEHLALCPGSPGCPTDTAVQEEAGDEGEEPILGEPGSPPPAVSTLPTAPAPPPTAPVPPTAPAAEEGELAEPDAEVGEPP